MLDVNPIRYVIIIIRLYYIKITLKIPNKQNSAVNLKYVMSNNKKYLPFIKYNKM